MALGLRPTLAGANPLNLPISDGIIFGDGFNPFSIVSSFTDIGNLLRCELMHWMEFSEVYRRNAVSDPSLLSRVRHVVLMSSKEKVTRIAARTIVASMAHAQSFRNLTIFNNPSDPVGIGGSASKLALSITSVFVNALFPVPALVECADINVFEEPVSKRRLFGPLGYGSFHSAINVALVCSHLSFMALVTTLGQG